MDSLRDGDRGRRRAHAERGTRFVQIYSGGGHQQESWDAHYGMEENLVIHAPEVDRPIHALLTDLKNRGMLEDTLVVFGGEFGRQPSTENGASKGRDHNPKGFTVWLAGAGVRRAHSHGATDEFGHAAAEAPATIYDLHATVLHLLGLDHERLSFYHNGAERRLTDVHGAVIEGVCA